MEGGEEEREDQDIWRRGRQRCGVEQTHAELKGKASEEGAVRPSDGATGKMVEEGRALSPDRAGDGRVLPRRAEAVGYEASQRQPLG